MKYYGDAYLLNTRLWEWSRGPEGALGTTAQEGYRVGHTMVLSREKAGGDDGACRVSFFAGQDGFGVRRSELSELVL